MIYGIVFANAIAYVKTDIDEKRLKTLVEEYFKLSEKDMKGFATFAESKGVKVTYVELETNIKHVFATHIHSA